MENKKQIYHLNTQFQSKKNNYRQDDELSFKDIKDKTLIIIPRPKKPSAEEVCEMLRYCACTGYRFLPVLQTLLFGIKLYTPDELDQLLQEIYNIDYTEITKIFKITQAGNDISSKVCASFVNHLVLSVSRMYYLYDKGKWICTSKKSVSSATFFYTNRTAPKRMILYISNKFSRIYEHLQERTSDRHTFLISADGEDFLRKVDIFDGDQILFIGFTKFEGKFPIVTKKEDVIPCSRADLHLKANECALNGNMVDHLNRYEKNDLFLSITNPDMSFVVRGAVYDCLSFPTLTARFNRHIFAYPNIWHIIFPNIRTLDDRDANIIYRNEFLDSFDNSDRSILCGIYDECYSDGWNVNTRRKKHVFQQTICDRIHDFCYTSNVLAPCLPIKLVYNRNGLIYTDRAEKYNGRFAITALKSTAYEASSSYPVTIVTSTSYYNMKTSADIADRTYYEIINDLYPVIVFSPIGIEYYKLSLYMNYFDFMTSYFAGKLPCKESVTAESFILFPALKTRIYDIEPIRPDCCLVVSKFNVYDNNAMMALAAIVMKGRTYNLQLSSYRAVPLRLPLGIGCETISFLLMTILGQLLENKYSPFKLIDVNDIKDINLEMYENNITIGTLYGARALENTYPLLSADHEENNKQISYILVIWKGINDIKLSSPGFGSDITYEQAASVVYYRQYSQKLLQLSTVINISLPKGRYSTDDINRFLYWSVCIICNTAYPRPSYRCSFVVIPQDFELSKDDASHSLSVLLESHNDKTTILTDILVNEPVPNEDNIVSDQEVDANIVSNQQVDDHIVSSVITFHCPYCDADHFRTKSGLSKHVQKHGPEIFAEWKNKLDEIKANEKLHKKAIKRSKSVKNDNIMIIETEESKQKKLSVEKYYNEPIEKKEKTLSKPSVPIKQNNPIPIEDSKSDRSMLVEPEMKSDQYYTDNSDSDQYIMASVPNDSNNPGKSLYYADDSKARPAKSLSVSELFPANKSLPVSELYYADDSQINDNPKLVKSMSVGELFLANEQKKPATSLSISDKYYTDDSKSVVAGTLTLNEFKENNNKPISLSDYPNNSVIIEEDVKHDIVKKPKADERVMLDNSNIKIKDGQVYFNDVYYKSLKGYEVFAFLNDYLLGYYQFYHRRENDIPPIIREAIEFVSDLYEINELSTLNLSIDLIKETVSHKHTVLSLSGQNKITAYDIQSALDRLQSSFLTKRISILNKVLYQLKEGKSIDVINAEALSIKNRKPVFVSEKKSPIKNTPQIVNEQTNATSKEMVIDLIDSDTESDDLNVVQKRSLHKPVIGNVVTIEPVAANTVIDKRSLSGFKPVNGEAHVKHPEIFFNQLELFANVIQDGQFVCPVCVAIGNNKSRSTMDKSKMQKHINRGNHAAVFYSLSEYIREQVTSNVFYAKIDKIIRKYKFYCDAREDNGKKGHDAAHVVLFDTDSLVRHFDNYEHGKHIRPLWGNKVNFIDNNGYFIPFTDSDPDYNIINNEQKQKNNNNSNNNNKSNNSNNNNNNINHNNNNNNNNSNNNKSTPTLEMSKIEIKNGKIMFNNIPLEELSLLTEYEDFLVQYHKQYTPTTVPKKINDAAIEISTKYEKKILMKHKLSIRKNYVYFQSSHILEYAPFIDKHVQQALMDLAISLNRDVKQTLNNYSKTFKEKQHNETNNEIKNIVYGDVMDKAINDILIDDDSQADDDFIPKVFTVYSTEKGAGKTFFITELFDRLTEYARKQRPTKLLLLDTNTNRHLTNTFISEYIHDVEKYSWSKNCVTDNPLPYTIIDDDRLRVDLFTSTVEDSPGFNKLLMREYSNNRIYNHLMIWFAKLRNNYDFIIIDMDSSLSLLNKSLLLLSDNIFVMTLANEYSTRGISALSELILSSKTSRLVGHLNKDKPKVAGFCLNRTSGIQLTHKEEEYVYVFSQYFSYLGNFPFISDFDTKQQQLKDVLNMIMNHVLRINNNVIIVSQPLKPLLEGKYLIYTDKVQGSENVYKFNIMVAMGKSSNVLMSQTCAEAVLIYFTKYLFNKTFINNTSVELTKDDITQISLLLRSQKTIKNIYQQISK